MTKTALFKLGGHRGSGCTDHDFYQDKRDIAALPVENTIESIKNVFKQGADYVEIDAVMSQDGVIFNLHNVVPKDHFFAADAPQELLNRMNFAEITRHKIGRTHHGTIARLDDILDYIASADPDTLPFAVNIEIKGVQGSGQNYESNDYLQRLADTVEQSSLPTERVLFSSFSLENIIRMSHLLPQAKYGMLFAERPDPRGIYSNHQDDMRYQYLPFNVNYLDIVVDEWKKSAHNKAALEYAHPEITTVTPEMISHSAKQNLGLNVWALFEDPDDARLAFYQNVAACAQEQNVPFTAITDYFPEMKKMQQP